MVVVTGRVDLEDFEEADVVVVVVVADCLIGGGGGRPMREEDLAEEDDFVSWREVGREGEKGNEKWVWMGCERRAG